VRAADVPEHVARYARLLRAGGVTVRMCPAPEGIDLARLSWTEVYYGRRRSVSVTRNRVVWSTWVHGVYAGTSLLSATALADAVDVLNVAAGREVK